MIAGVQSGNDGVMIGKCFAGKRWNDGFRLRSFCNKFPEVWWVVFCYVIMPEAIKRNKHYIWLFLGLRRNSQKQPNYKQIFFERVHEDDFVLFAPDLPT